MTRLFVLSFFSIFLFVSETLAQTGEAGWSRLRTIVIDPSRAGSQTIELPETAISAVRLSSKAAVSFTAIQADTDPAEPLVLAAGTPSKPFSIYGGEVLTLKWAAQPSLGRAVEVEIWTKAHSSGGKKKKKGGRSTISQEEAKAGSAPSTEAAEREKAAADAKPSARQAEEARAREAAEAAARAAREAAAAKPQSRGIGGVGIGSAPPPPVAAPQPSATTAAPRPAPPPPPPVIASAEGRPNVCVDQAVCTIVDVFFGTDRKPAMNPNRADFGSDRAGVLQLGHAFVTVPKAARKRGEIPLPGTWDKWVRGVPAEGDPARHFTIPKNGAVVFSTEDEFLAAAKQHIATAGDFKDHAFIFVHGFYVTFDNALYRAAQISYDLSSDGKPFGTAFLYSWPSAGGAMSYITDQDSARLATDHLYNFMKLVVDKTGVKNVHLIAHSMGNVALLGALQRFALTEKTVKFNQIILAAPDIDKAEFERIVVDVSKIAKGITMYASQGDRALYASRKAHGGFPRAGETVLPPGPAVAKGVDTIDVTSISTAAFWGHDTYADSSEILADIATVFIKGDPPPKRSPKIRFGALKYWIYDK